jgi:pSer/pThr/pTyr-binding forkhead associated (FHA) protein
MPRLTLVETGSAKSHRVDGSEVLAGRDPACGILLEGDEARTVSGRHARFFFENDTWYVEDAGSRNGTYIGTRRLEPGARHPLAVGEVVGFGLTGSQLTVRELGGRSLAATMLEAAPTPLPMPARGEAIRVAFRGPTGLNLAGQGDRITIGRSLECVIRIEGESATSVSRIHAEITSGNGQVTVRDGGSRHGTFLNGQKIDAPSPLRIGDVLMLGPGGPTLTVEQLEPIAGGAAASAAASQANEGSVAPTSVRPAPQKRASPSKPARDGESDPAAWPTPPTDVPSFRKSPPRAPRPRTSGSRQRRSAPAMLGAAVLLVAVIAAGVFIARSR